MRYLTYALLSFFFTNGALADPLHSEVADSAAPQDQVNVSLPHCVQNSDEVQKVVDVIKANTKKESKYDGYRAALQSDSDVELVARLAYAETLAANCPELNLEVGSRITEVIVNRVQIKKGNVRGVVFKRDQFASSMNVYTESRYLDFLCPKDLKLWQFVLHQASAQMSKPGNASPSHTVNYYLYKHSPKYPKETWKLEEDTSEATPEVAKCLKLFKDPKWK